MSMKRSFILFLATVIVVIPLYDAHAATATKAMVSAKAAAIKVPSKTPAKAPAKTITTVKKPVTKPKTVTKTPSKTPATASTTTSVTAMASSSFEVSGWIPYWRTATGMADVLPHIAVFTEVNPFGFTVKQDGTLNDALKIQDPAWLALKAAASTTHTRYIPTVMWSDTASIHTVLSNPMLRATHEASIAQAITANGLDGIDIDYEGKSADDQANFSSFLQELSLMFAKDKMNKWLVCTIEAREPLEARYSGTPPADIAYANDLKAINTYCDRVRIMTYDQENADIQLNQSHNKELYMPIADPAWVTKVVNYMAQDIDKKKMVLGVATYGYIYQTMPNTDGSGYSYDLLEAFNPRYATDLAASLGITPVRNAAGELSFSYVPSTTNALLPSNSALSALAPNGTSGANLAAAGALTLAQTKHQQAPVQYLTWSDASAVKDKVSLAKQLGLRGIAIFKLDGGEDQNIWNIVN